MRRRSMASGKIWRSAQQAGSSKSVRPSPSSSTQLPQISAVACTPAFGEGGACWASAGRAARTPVTPTVRASTMRTLSLPPRTAKSKGYAREQECQAAEAARRDAPFVHGRKPLRGCPNRGRGEVAASRASDVRSRAGMGDRVRIANASGYCGDDLLARVDELLAAGVPLAHLDDGRPLATVRDRVVAANAYLGARPIAQALAAGADIVVTGRTTDAALTLGPLVHELGWASNDWDRLAAGTVAGHVLECGAQATGGNLTDWQRTAPLDVGYPVAEVAADGGFVVTKPAGSGGGAAAPDVEPNEGIFRAAVRDPDRTKVERFAHTLLGFALQGPPGLGVFGGRPEVQEAYAYWPALVPRDLVRPRVEIVRGDA